MALRGFIIAAAAIYCYYDFSPLYQAPLRVFIYSQYLFIYPSRPVRGPSTARPSPSTAYRGRGVRRPSDRTIIIGHRAKPVAAARFVTGVRARALIAFASAAARQRY